MTKKSENHSDYPTLKEIEIKRILDYFRFMNGSWIKNQLPIMNGFYWLYGKIWSDEKNKLYFIEIKEVSNGFLCIYSGTFLWDNDIKEDFYITPVMIPELPKL